MRRLIVIFVLALMLPACAAQRPNPYNDILNAYSLQLDQIREDVAAGRMTPTQGKALAAKLEADANTQVELRRAARAIRSY